jgi:hypothetical protein
MRVYGPYKRKDGRQHVVIVYADGDRQTKSYPRYLLEQHLGRELNKDETVDHIDNDFTNNSISNLQILPRSDNTKKAFAFNPAETAVFTCPECFKSFIKLLADVRHNNIKRKKAGPFCSKACSGRYGSRLQKTFRGGRKNPRYTGA